MSEPYKEQFERVKRHLSRFDKIDSGQSHDKASDYHKDDVYSFFQNCYHLKDWIKNDPSCSGVDVEAFINSTPDLQICADICNGTKHLTLSRPRSTESPTFTGQHIRLNIQDGFGVTEKIDISIKYTISTNSGDIDAFDLAKRCVAHWGGFISANCP
ncbi:MAG: hypothetical protein NVV74_15820 [Magnetospirillum sp.]|nr:hypothetical protein [Magnetospirillum sp.]